VIKLALEGGFNGIAIQIGLAEKFFWGYAGEVQLALKLDGKTDIPGAIGSLSPVNASVRDAVRLGADAVGYTLYVGSPAQEHDFGQYLAIRDETRQLGMSLTVWSYPRGAAIDGKGGKDSFYTVDYAALTASELGADVVKVSFPHSEKRAGVPAAYQADFRSPQAIDAVVRSANRTLLLVSGGERRRRRHAREGRAVDGGRRHRADLRPQRMAARPRRVAALRRPAPRDPGQISIVTASRLRGTDAALRGGL
jgi:fructose-bisphosphate aldolase, class I